LISAGLLPVPPDLRLPLGLVHSFMLSPGPVADLGAATRCRSSRR
jgi:hypothetical protein